MDKIQKDNRQWKEELDPEVYSVTRERGTEAPFSGKYYKHKESGNYVCSNCGLELFSSKAKYDSGSGWPSFDDPVAKDNVDLVPDYSHGMSRMEVVCAKCDAHLGHVFDDGPQDTTGKRYCINSCSLDFKKENK
ncbi:peptide-methionine (R)-S-oxide reductase MsrB [Candidatus Nomurabacteria bacterium]|nr:peptide-methionine (R)-S-oxide reductase MsrB [Candidatus Nomurabacteria bacterium]